MARAAAPAAVARGRGAIGRRVARIVQPTGRLEVCATRTGAAKTGTGAALGAAEARQRRLQAGGAHVGDDRGIGVRQRRRQGPAQFGQQHLALVGAIGDLVDAADDGVADDLRPQRVARRVSVALQHGADEPVELALLGLAVLGALQSQPLGADLEFDLLVVDQAQRVPAGRVQGPLRAVARQHLALDAAVQRLVEPVAEQRQLAVQLELRAQQRVALEHVGRGERRHAEAVHGALGRLAGGELCPRAASMAAGRPRAGVWFMGRGSMRHASATDPPAQGPRTGQACYFLNASRISRSSCTSSGVAGGGGGGAADLSLLICRTMMKMMKARMTKFSATVMKLP